MDIKKFEDYENVNEEVLKIDGYTYQAVAKLVGKAIGRNVDTGAIVGVDHRGGGKYEIDVDTGGLRGNEDIVKVTMQFKASDLQELKDAYKN